TRGQPSTRPGGRQPVSSTPTAWPARRGGPHPRERSREPTALSLLDPLLDASPTTSNVCRVEAGPEHARGVLVLAIRTKEAFVLRPASVRASPPAPPRHRQRHVPQHEAPARDRLPGAGITSSLC